MGVKPVDGYGLINSGNAKEIYLKYKHGEIDLEVSQQKYCESFLSPKDWDDIEYDTETNKKEGYEQIEDTKKADDHSNQRGNAAATTAANFAAISGMAHLMTIADGFSSVVMSLVCLGFALVQAGIAKLFDNGYSDRCDANDNSDNTNSIIDAQNEQLQESMDMMNEDMAVYDETSQEYMVSVNSMNADLANMQVELADAQAAGDKASADSLKAQIQAMQGETFEGEEEELQGMRDGLNEYRVMSDESNGVADGGRSVSNFLKEGYELSVYAGINAALNVAAGLWMAGVFCTPKLAPIFPDCPASEIANINKYVACAAFVGAAGVWGNKAVKEVECGVSGDEMGSHTAELEGMIKEQTGYIEETEGFYGEADAARAEDNAQGETMANDNSTANGGLLVKQDPGSPSKQGSNPFAPA